jgi:hypothetical protein
VRVRDGRGCVIADLLDGADERLRGDERRVVGDRRRLGRVVDRRLDSLELVEDSLDPRGARGARHPLERERRLLARLLLFGDGAHRQVLTTS